MKTLQDTYQTVEGKVQQYIALPQNGERLFLFALFFYMTNASLLTTMFQVGGPILTSVNFLLIGSILFKIIVFDRYTEKELCFAAGLLFDAVVVMIFSGYYDVFYFSVILLGAKNVPFVKILKVYLMVNVAVLLSAFIASRLDIIEDLVYVRDFLGERNSFGIIYPTDFAAHIFFLLSAGYYIIREKLQPYHIFLGAVICIVVYYYCKTRLDCIAMALLLLGLWIMRHEGIWQNTTGNQQKVFVFLQKMIPWSGTAGFIVMYLLSLFYMPNVFVFRFVDELLTGRLKIASQGLQEYGFSLFGHHIEMQGSGGSLIASADYFFIDSSFLFVYMCYGIVFLCFILFIHYSCCKKYAEDGYFLLILSVIAINCMIAHHMIDLAYNPFYLALLAKKETV